MNNFIIPDKVTRNKLYNEYMDLRALYPKRIPTFVLDVFVRGWGIRKDYLRNFLKDYRKKVKQ